MPHLPDDNFDVTDYDARYDVMLLLRAGSFREALLAAERYQRAGLISEAELNMVARYAEVGLRREQAGFIAPSEAVCQEATADWEKRRERRNRRRR